MLFLIKVEDFCKKIELKKQACCHCGLSFIHQPIRLNSKYFCCVGCRTVYQLLEGLNLDAYYSINQHPGNKPPQQKQHFAYLDDEVYLSKLITFQKGSTVHVTLNLPAIHCSACIWILEQLDKLILGVVDSSVNFSKKEIYLVFNSKQVSLSSIAEKLSSIGYPPNIHLESSATQPNKINRRLWTQIGISGFAFGNSMFLSLPHYFEHNELWLNRLNPFFSLLLFLMSIPVVFYAAQDYYVAAWSSLKTKVLSLDVPISLGVTVLFLSSCHAVFLTDQLGYFDSLAGLVFFLLLGKFIQDRTYKAFSFERDYQSFFPIGVTRIDSDKNEKVILLEDVRKEDKLILKTSELIPVDGLLLSKHTFIDYSFVTGESTPVRVVKGEAVYAGGRIEKHSCLIIASHTMLQSKLIQLWNQEAFRKKEEPNFQVLTRKVSRYFTPIILFIALLSAIFWWTIDPSQVPFIIAAVLIVACPCALALSTPFVMGNMIRYFGRLGLYLKNTHVIEQIDQINHIVLDKTGTLTQSSSKEISFKGRPLSKEEKNILGAVFYTSNHPLSKSLFKFLAVKISAPNLEYTHHLGFGITANVSEKIVKVGAAQLMDSIPDSATTNHSVVHVQINQEYRGYFTIPQLLRPGIHSFLTSIINYPITLLSGDNSSDHSRLVGLMPKHTNFHFNQNPFQKINYIQKLQTEKKQVMMIGDGLNDAGALKQADLGLAVANQAHAFTPACDAILRADKLRYLHHFIWASKKSVSLIKWSFIISFFYNCIGVGIAVAGLLNPLIAAILMPLSSISVVVFAYCSTALINRKLEKKIVS